MSLVTATDIAEHVQTLGCPNPGKDKIAGIKPVREGRLMGALLQVRAAGGFATDAIRTVGYTIELDWKGPVGYNSVASFVAAAVPKDLRQLFRLRLRQTGQAAEPKLGTKQTRRKLKAVEAEQKVFDEKTDAGKPGSTSRGDTTSLPPMHKRQDPHPPSIEVVPPTKGSRKRLRPARKLDLQQLVPAPVPTAAGVQNADPAQSLWELTLSLACRTSQANFDQEFEAPQVQAQVPGLLLTVSKITGKQVMVKRCRQDSWESVLREVAILSRLQEQENIQHLLETWNVAGDLRLVMDCIDHTLSSILKPGPPAVIARVVGPSCRGKTDPSWPCVSVTWQVHKPSQAFCFASALWPRSHGDTLGFCPRLHTGQGACPGPFLSAHSDDGVCA